MFCLVCGIIKLVISQIGIRRYVNQPTSQGHELSLFLKGSQLGAFCPYAIVYCYLEFKLRYLKNLNLLSIRVKLFEPIVLRKKATGFCSI